MRVSAVKRGTQPPVASMFSFLKSLATRSPLMCHSTHDTRRLKKKPLMEHMDRL